MWIWSLLSLLLCMLLQCLCCCSYVCTCMPYSHDQLSTEPLGIEWSTSTCNNIRKVATVVFLHKDIELTTYTVHRSSFSATWILATAANKYKAGSNMTYNVFLIILALANGEMYIYQNILPCFKLCEHPSSLTLVANFYLVFITAASESLRLWSLVTI